MSKVALIALLAGVVLVEMARGTAFILAPRLLALPGFGESFAELSRGSSRRRRFLAELVRV